MNYARPAAAIARSIRFSDTGIGVPSCCANRLTRSSSISQEIATTPGCPRRASGSE